MKFNINKRFQKISLFDYLTLELNEETHSVFLQEEGDWECK